MLSGELADQIRASPFRAVPGKSASRYCWKGRRPILAGRFWPAFSASIWLVRMPAELRSPASMSGRTASAMRNSSGFSVVVKLQRINELLVLRPRI
jgi:hypothetical protein